MSLKKYLPLSLVAISLLGAGCSASSNATTGMMDDGTKPNGNAMQPANQNAIQQQGMMVGGAMMIRNLDIVANAMNASNMTTLVTAVKAAGLVDTLKSPGPFTVFTPTNAAFNKLPAGTVNTLLKPENRAMLTSILTYHVVPGALKSTDLRDGQMLTTVEGKQLKVTKSGNTIMVNGVKIETADAISSNGVTHVIDTVLMPPTM